MSEIGSMVVFLFLMVMGFLVSVIASIKKNKKRTLDFYALFIIGVVWIFSGLFIQSIPLSLLGLAFAIVGISNKRKWIKNEIQWNKLSKKEKTIKILSIVALCVLILMGVLLYFLNSRFFY